MSDEYTNDPHQFIFHPRFGKNYCPKCGLIALNNKFSQWAVQKGCLNEDHPGYKAARKRYTRLDQ